MAERVLLTGITGYIGQHCAAELLKQGYEVVGTMRSRSKAEGTRAALARVTSVDRLSFAEADLLSDHGWDDAIKGCGFALHVASPFVMTEPRDENELIAPAVEGTRRVVAAAQRAGVKRLVLTSSTFALVAGKASGTYGPDAWSDTGAAIGAYSKSKTLAERAAWQAVEGGAMEMVVINPGAVFGPSLGAQIDGQSVAMVTKMIAGKMPMIPDVAMGMIDVRDVGYAVHAARRDLEAWAQAPEPVTVYVITDVREDAITLYGFSDDLDRVTFERLRLVEGIGPKVALSTLDTLSREQLSGAVENDEHAVLCRVPGVGKKLASMSSKCRWFG